MRGLQNIFTSELLKLLSLNQFGMEEKIKQFHCLYFVKRVQNPAAMIASFSTYFVSDCIVYVLQLSISTRASSIPDEGIFGQCMGLVSSHHRKEFG